MNYYELIYLKRELKHKFIGGFIEQVVTPYKNFLEFFVIGQKNNYRLQFSAAPGNIALFSDSYRGAKKSNTINFFSSIYNEKITDIEIAETDRWLFIVFENQHSIKFRLFSNRANAFLTKGNEIVEAFKDYDEPGDEIPQPKKIDLFEGKLGNKSTKNKLLTLNPMLPRANISELIDIHELNDASDEKILQFTRSISKKMENEAVFRLLKNGNTTLLPEDMLPVPTEKTFSEVNDLISYRYKNQSNYQRLKQKKEVLLKNLNRQIKKLKSTLKNLENAEKGLDRAEEYEQFGHLLMAHAHLEDVDGKYLEVANLYDDGTMLKIPLQKEDADIAENAQHYYKKAQNAKRSYEEAQKRIPEVKAELTKNEQLLAKIESIKGLWEFQDWEKEHSDELSEFYNASSKTNDDENLPFYTFKVKDFTIWIGKNAKSNDKLVQKAHKEDVWMHARGVAGSHLVIRMGNEKTMPPKEVILEAASYAAYNSKARGSDLAPVIVTKMKYVRKSKGAAPGAVVVDKEEVEMVSPKKPKE